MTKCSQCRKNPVKDSWWDKIRLYFFHFYHNDIIDLSQDKFTQGFSDGYVMGRKHQKEESDKLIALLSEPVEKEKIPLPIVDLNKVLTENKGKLYLNNIPLEAKKVDDLKQEAHLFRNTSLWELITNTLESQAYEAGWTKSKNWEDLLAGKTISYTIDVQKKIIEKIEKAK